MAVQRRTKRTTGSTNNRPKRVIKIDLREAQPGGGRQRFPEDDYKVELTTVEATESQNGNPQLKVTYKIVEGKYEGKTIIDYMSLSAKAAWRIGNLLDALGMKWSQSVLSLDPDKVEGKQLGVTLADDEYQGKVRSKIADFLDEDTIDGILEGSGEEQEEEEEDEEEEDLDELDVDDEL